ncbi:DEAD/DEAH box helicase family protein [Myroides odoratimimus]|uniref:DEAD/DEAH box helicase n=1 Tax=Myroides odoratimimus TaxID=76832 RepID=UPI00257667E7|nr:DEAD/DEAH box helicase family protein [Myroides odoratimimus]MDM1397771.1 DEAD/DEAH box helicase family protein [Myroides odoratimimus]
MEYLAGNIANDNDYILKSIWETISQKYHNEDWIMGYKTPSFGKSVDETPSIIIRSSEFGITLIDIVSDEILEFDEENEYWNTRSNEYVLSRDIVLELFEKELINKLKDDNRLYDIRKDEFKFELTINKLLVFSQNKEEEIKKINAEANVTLCNNYVCSDNWTDFHKFWNVGKENIHKQYLDIIDSIFDGSYVYGNTTKRKVTNDSEVTMSSLIKESLNTIFKLDSTQRQVALQIPAGPQRIRGLAGTGKTIILCMKAALVHKFYPEMKILFVFNTQSMYNQVEGLITKYYFNETGKMPDFSKLNILHAWGGSNKPGLYYNTAKSLGIKPLNFMNVKYEADPLDAIYKNLLYHGKEQLTAYYDMVLIDEAQDFPSSFFETIYLLTKFSDDTKLKRIIWAYDEFQSLTDIKIKEPKELFGINKDGEANMPNDVIEGEYLGNIKKDFILPNSYRNPRIVLMVAHGLALGLYTDRKVPMLYRDDWEARGYTLLTPDKSMLTEGDNAKLTRPERNSKNDLEKILQSRNSEEKLIQIVDSETNQGQLEKVVQKVKNIIIKQKVEPDEIIIIDIDTKNSKSNFEFIRQALDYEGIKCITPGYIESNDLFKEKGFVTLTTPFRAKGNETNVVLIINTNKILNDRTFRIRNSMFVSITRSRGWCYLFTNGLNNSKLKDEFDMIIKDYPNFNFTVPSIESIQRRYSILTSTKDLEKYDNQLDLMLKDKELEALLVEKLLSNPALIEKLKSGKNENR